MEKCELGLKGQDKGRTERPKASLLTRLLKMESSYQTAKGARAREEKGGQACAAPTVRATMGSATRTVQRTSRGIGSPLDTP